MGTALLRRYLLWVGCLLFAAPLALADTKSEIFFDSTLSWEEQQAEDPHHIEIASYFPELNPRTEIVLTFNTNAHVQSWIDGIS